MKVTFLSESFPIKQLRDIQTVTQGKDMDISLASPIRGIGTEKVLPNSKNCNSVFLLDGTTRGLVVAAKNIILASVGRCITFHNDWPRYENCLVVFRYSPTMKKFTDERALMIGFEGTACMSERYNVEWKKSWLKELSKRTNDIVKEAARFSEKTFKTYRDFEKELHSLVDRKMPKDFLETGSMSGRPHYYSI